MSVFFNPVIHLNKLSNNNEINVNDNYNSNFNL